MRRMYLCATLLLSFGLCGLSLTSCGEDEEEKLSEVTVPGAGNGNQSGTTIVNGHEAVDLGLSVKWATCNVGASSPEEYGGYYAWGETEEKNYYDWSTYKYCNGSNETFTKYCTNSDYGTVDNKTVLEPGDDVAHVKWGGSWRMPTKEEINELCNNCSWTWTSKSEVNGYVVTSISNGNSIFLPAAGGRRYGFVNDSGSDGYFWSASLYESDSYYACNLNFYSGFRFLNDYLRLDGNSVRPVTE